MGAVLAATIVKVGEGSAETAAVPVATTAAGIGGGGTETGAVPAAAAAVERGGTEMGAVLATAVETGTSALGELLRERAILKPAPRAREKRAVRTAPSGVLSASTMALAQSMLLFAGDVPDRRRCMWAPL
jgi:hypothetical protein